MPQAPMGNSSDVRIGDPVAAIGAPFGQVESLSSGIVSQIGTQIIAPAAVCLRTTDAIQTDTAINPGNSGGPLFDAAGKVIGVNSQIDTGGVTDSNTGVSFAVPVNAARRSLDEIAATRRVHYAWLGIGGITLTSDIANALQGRATSGVLVSFVDKGSAAEAAGITPGTATTTVNGRQVNSEGDVIVGFAGKPIRTLEDLQRAVSLKRPNDRVTVKWWDGATLRSRSMTLGERNLTDPEVCRATTSQ
jgi:S1-C subfamily serine protease